MSRIIKAPTGTELACKNWLIEAAYRMILESFWKGDLEAMRPLVDGHVYETFAAAVEQRTKDGLVLDNRLVNVEQALIGAHLAPELCHRRHAEAPEVDQRLADGHPAAADRELGGDPRRARGRRA